MSASFCGLCGCPAEPLKQPNVHGYVHACKHVHKHLIPYTVSEHQRDRLSGSRSGTKVSA